MGHGVSLPSVSQIITVAAVALTDGHGRIFLVRKRGTTRWMQPGGKPEPGETPVEAAAREVEEELGLSLAPERLDARGQWTGSAANEAGATLLAHLFSARWDGLLDPEPVAGAELAEGRWMRPEEALRRDDLAPLLREAVLPALLAGRA